jgi:hypothetical protein
MDGLEVLEPSQIAFTTGTIPPKRPGKPIGSALKFAGYMEDRCAYALEQDLHSWR